jgi:hypothetical protein
MGPDNLASAVNEKDVENLYRHNFLKKFKDMQITSPFGCDGLGVSKSDNVRVLMEYKDDLNLYNKADLAKVLAQSIFYIKKFYDKGMVPPSTIFVADRNECTAIHVNDVIDYLDLDLNWNIAPSQAHTITELVLKLIHDENIKPFIFSSDNFTDCIDKVKDLTDNVQRKVLVTDINITEVFRYFDEKVLGKNKLTTNERANLFVQLLVNSDDNYLHPVSKRKMVVTKSFGEIPISSRDGFTSFFAHFSSSYTPSQKHKLAAVVDRIVEDTTRRRQGEFFTPAIWVDKAHEYIASVYGEDWKDKYVVWDPAWGTGNLTRDYQFKELYVSTLNQSDIDTANQMGYNPEATKFQYDFLNDDYEKLPEGLRKAIEQGREVICLMNPPYASSANKSTVEEDHKVGVSNTKVSVIMKQQDWGKSVQNLYSQFFFKVFDLNETSNLHMAIFSPPLFLSGPSFKKFRKKFFSKYQFKKGFLFSANNFSDVANGWGIGFSILESYSTVNYVTQYEFDTIMCDESFYLHTQGSKTIYNTDNQVSASEWLKTDLKNFKTQDAPQQSSPCVIKQKGVGSLIPNSLGYFLSNSNNVQFNRTGCSLFSSCYSGGHGISIIPQNFLKVTSFFSARKMILETWEIQKDEYLVPTSNEVFESDSIIYSMFSTYSYQSSLRQVEYKGQMWDIKNEFFWMSRDRMKDLADNMGYDELYNDARTASDRHVYKLLFGEERIYDKLSPDAKAVLDKATELVELSMEMRQVMANDENHLNSWDAGYAQLKLVWKEYFPEQFKEFRQLYKNMEERMRPLVYDLGFLMK